MYIFIVYMYVHMDQINLWHILLEEMCINSSEK